MTYRDGFGRYPARKRNGSGFLCAERRRRPQVEVTGRHVETGKGPTHEFLADLEKSVSVHIRDYKPAGDRR